MRQRRREGSSLELYGWCCILVIDRASTYCSVTRPEGAVHSAAAQPTALGACPRVRKWLSARCQGQTYGGGAPTTDDDPSDHLQCQPALPPTHATAERQPQ